MIISVNHVVHIPNPADYGGPKSYVFNVKYKSLLNVRTLIERSESCKQYVSYKCTNATLFGNKEFALSSWTSVGNSPYTYWAGCSFSNRSCKCDQGNSKSEEDNGYLTKKQELPVKSLQIGGLSEYSNVTVTIGSVVCYGGWFLFLIFIDFT